MTDTVSNPDRSKQVSRLESHKNLARVWVEENFNAGLATRPAVVAGSLAASRGNVLAARS